MKNCSPVLDSCFNVQTKGEENTNQSGKIHVENATTQALREFLGFDRTGDKEKRRTNVGNVEESMRAEDRPLLGLFTKGSVSVEMVSWFGTITLQYSMEETVQDLG